MKGDMPTDYFINQYLPKQRILTSAQIISLDSKQNIGSKRRTVFDL